MGEWELTEHFKEDFRVGRQKNKHHIRISNTSEDPPEDSARAQLLGTKAEKGMRKANGGGGGLEGV